MAFRFRPFLMWLLLHFFLTACSSPDHSFTKFHKSFDISGVLMRQKDGPDATIGFAGPESRSITEATGMAQLNERNSDPVSKKGVRRRFAGIIERRKQRPGGSVYHNLPQFIPPKYVAKKKNGLIL